MHPDQRNFQIWTQPFGLCLGGWAKPATEHPAGNEPPPLLKRKTLGYGTTVPWLHAGTGEARGCGGTFAGCPRAPSRQLLQKPGRREDPAGAALVHFKGAEGVES